jgi:hypothetical protein
MILPEIRSPPATTLQLCNYVCEEREKQNKNRERKNYERDRHIKWQQGGYSIDDNRGSKSILSAI